MEIEWLEQGYTRHGCNILASEGTKIGMVDYNAHTTNHEFGGAYKKGGMLQWLDKAKALVLGQYPNAVIKLGIPDLVFEVKQPKP